MDPRPQELQAFVQLLTDTAPDGYEPHLIALEEGGKGPDLNRGSWKEANLSLPDAVAHMRDGGNVGLAAMEDDPLVIVDLDDDEEIIQADALPHTLMVRSRSRRGIHGFYWGDVPNPSKPGKGEIRAQNQYVVAAGSHVHTAEEEAPDPEDPDLGYYTLLVEEEPQPITKDQLPAFFYPDREQQQQHLTTSGEANQIDVEPRLEYALSIDPELADLWKRAPSNHDDEDRSEREFKLAGRLGFYFENDRRTVARLMDRSGAHKWTERDDDSYRDSVLDALEGNTDLWEPGKKYADWAHEQLDHEIEDTHTGSQPTTWDQIRKMVDENPSDHTDPRWEAVQLLLEEMDLITVDESLEMYWYDPSCGYWLPRGENEVSRRLAEYLGKHYSTNWKRETINFINNLTTQPFDEAFKPTEGAICVANGTLELNPEEPILRDHSPEDRFLGAMDVEWDPDAEAPTWEAFLSEVTDEKGSMQLQEMVGYCLHHWGVPIHKSLWVVGPTASGKSTALSVIMELFGDAGAVSLAPQQMVERFGGAQLLGALVNVRSDIPESTLNKTGAFKSILAGDDLKAEKKNKEPFFFQPTAKHIFAANTLPDVSLDDDAFFRRILLVPFPQTVPAEQRQRDMKQQILEELPGVLRWAVEGYYRLMEQGNFTDEPLPGEVMEQWSMWANTVDRFAQRVITTSADADPIIKAHLYSIYTSWCENFNMPAEHQQVFTQRLKQAHGVVDGRVTVDGKQQRCYLNVKMPEEYWDLISSVSSTADQQDLSDL